MLLNAKKLLSKLLITAAVLAVAAVPAFADEQENFAAESVSVETMLLLSMVILTVRGTPFPVSTSLRTTLNSTDSLAK